MPNYKRGDIEVGKEKSKYLLTVFAVSIIIFVFTGTILKTNDGTISYLLSLLSSIFLVKEFDKKN